LNTKALYQASLVLCNGRVVHYLPNFHAKIGTKEPVW
jgi:hypothetical protein